jgi:hypothetical protein
MSAPAGGAGGTNVTPSNAHAAAQAANLAAPTVINFAAVNGGVSGGQFDQTSKATATATASQGPAAATVGGGDFGGGGPNYLLIGAIAGAALLIVATIIITRK